MGTDADTGATGDFASVFARADPVPGWLTEAQAAVLFDEVRRLDPGSRVIEIGSHQGRSTIVLAGAREDVEVVAIDPFAGGKYGGAGIAALLERHLETAGVAARVRQIPRPSEELRATWREPFRLLYVDGAHDPAHAYDDLRWAHRMADGDTVLVHDCFSAVGVTVAVMWAAVRREPLRYLRREGSLATFVVDHHRTGRVSDLRGELPWFLRNLLVKVLRRLRLTPLAARMGHRGPFDPY